MLKYPKDKKNVGHVFDMKENMDAFAGMNEVKDILTTRQAKLVR